MARNVRVKFGATSERNEKIWLRSSDGQLGRYAKRGHCSEELCSGSQG